MPKNQFTLDDLFEVTSKKIAKKEKNSYTYQLAREGLEKITRKVGEEALEVIIASFVNRNKKTKRSRDELVGEVADLFYHTLVLLASQGIKLSEVNETLSKRNKAKK